MDPAFFTVRTPCARTHQQQLACMHERTGMHEPAYMLLLLLLHVNGGGNLILKESGNRGPRRYRIL